jgi:hemoglobin-like flavoprotein
MTPEQISIVQSGWEKILPMRERAATLFWARLFEIGRRPQQYGVQVSQQEAVAEALLWTLEECLDREFSLRARQAWSLALLRIVEAMQQGAEPPPLFSNGTH